MYVSVNQKNSNALSLESYTLGNIAQNAALRPKLVKAKVMAPLIQLLKGVPVDSNYKLITSVCITMKKLVEGQGSAADQLISEGVFAHLQKVQQSELNGC